MFSVLVLRRAGSASPGNISEMNILKLHLRHPESETRRGAQNLCVNKPSRECWSPSTANPIPSSCACRTAQDQVRDNVTKHTLSSFDVPAPCKSMTKTTVDLSTWVWCEVLPLYRDIIKWGSRILGHSSQKEVGFVSLCLSLGALANRAWQKCPKASKAGSEEATPLCLTLLTPTGTLPLGAHHHPARRSSPMGRPQEVLHSPAEDADIIQERQAFPLCPCPHPWPQHPYTWYGD